MRTGFRAAASIVVLSIPTFAAVDVASGGTALVRVPGACRAASGAVAIPLVELYTSEGCNSCPPADRWLSSTWPPGAPATTPGVPLAFHVDYWDRLGWPDRFARPEWSARQQELARAAKSGVVYTPQIALQGRDFGEWRSAGARAAIARSAALPGRAQVVVEVETAANGRLRAKAEGQAPSGAGRLRLALAYADGGHVTDVKRGENAGVRLVHDHVVRAMATSAASAGESTIRVDLDVPASDGAVANPKFVAFVERIDTREVLQAVALSLADCGR